MRFKPTFGLLQPNLVQRRIWLVQTAEKLINQGSPLRGGELQGLPKY